MTPVRIRPAAESDLVERTRYFGDAEDAALAGRFFDAAVDALSVVGERPEGGSLRIGELCGIDGLRVRAVAGFPCGWFYFTRSDHIDVVRLLAFAQDLPAELDDLTEP